MAAFSWGTLADASRRTGLWPSSRNQRSAQWNRLELVGTGCRPKRGWFFNHFFTCHACPRRGCRRAGVAEPHRREPGQGCAGSCRAPDSCGADRSGRSPAPWGLKGGEERGDAVALVVAGMCRHDPSSSAARAGCGRPPGSGSSRSRTARPQGLGKMALEAGACQGVDRGLGAPLCLGEDSSVAVRHPFGLALQGGLHFICHLLPAIGRLPAAFGCDLPQSIPSLPDEVSLSEHDSFVIDRGLLDDGAVQLPHPVRPASHGNLLRASASSRSRLQLSLARHGKGKARSAYVNQGGISLRLLRRYRTMHFVRLAVTDCA